MLAPSLISDLIDEPSKGLVSFRARTTPAGSRLQSMHHPRRMGRSGALNESRWFLNIPRCPTIVDDHDIIPLGVPADRDRRVAVIRSAELMSSPAMNPLLRLDRPFGPIADAHRLGGFVWPDAAESSRGGSGEDRI